MRRPHAWCVLVALLVARSAVAQPQPKPLAETLTGSAKADYDTGKLLFADGDFVAAEIKFKSAFDATHDARLLWNMAACEKSQHRYARAVALVREYLDGGQNVISESDRNDAKALLATLASLIVDLKIDVDQPGAEVLVDGESVGITPLAKPVVVDIGNRTVTVRKEHFKEATREIQVGSERTASMAIHLEPEAPRVERVETITRVVAPTPPSLEKPYVPEYKGLYGRASLFFLFGGGGFYEPPPAAQAALDQTGPGIYGNAGVEGVIGYSFDPFAIEIRLAFEGFGDFGGARYEYAKGTTTEVMRVSTFSLFESGYAGLGGRVTSRHRMIRFTGGLSAGAYFGVVNGDVNIDAYSGPGSSNMSTGYASFGLVADGGLLLGHSTGAKFYLGARFAMNFLGDVVFQDSRPGLPAQYFNAPPNGWKLLSGPMVYFGPTLGIQLGH